MVKKVRPEKYLGGGCYFSKFFLSKRVDAKFDQNYDILILRYVFFCNVGCHILNDTKWHWLKLSNDFYVDLWSNFVIYWYQIKRKIYEVQSFKGI